MTKMNGARAVESAREDRENILSLRKVFVRGPWYMNSEVDVGSLDEVESSRHRIDPVESRGPSHRMCDKPCPQGRGIRNGIRCMDDGRETGTDERNERPSKVCHFPDGQE